MTNRRHRGPGLASLVIALTLGGAAAAESWIERVEGYERYRELLRGAGSIGKDGTISELDWSPDGRTLDYTCADRRHRVDLETGAVVALVGDGAEQVEEGTDPAGTPPRVKRGAQRSREPSPDGRWHAVSRGWNVILESGDGETELAITTDGTRKHRFGRASWVYGEELRQKSAMWWSPDSRTLAFYEFDERGVEDFLLLDDLTERRPRRLVEGYPKPGETNPVASLHLYDLETGAMTRVDTGLAAPESIGHYVYEVRFAPSGDELLFNRMNRRQSAMELAAANVGTGETRVIVRETQETWQDNHPTIRFLDDGRRFIWETERSGFAHYELRSMSGDRLATLTRGAYPVRRIVDVDEEAGRLYYTASSDPDRPLDVHLHRVDFDGTGDVRLTREPMNHQVRLSPDRRFFVTTFRSVTEAPTTALHRVDGERVAILAEADAAEIEAAVPVPPELFSFTAADGATTIYGTLHKPSGFDPAKRYPLLVDVYGGPFSRKINNRFVPVAPICELGFLLARIDNRGTVGRGKAFESATYRRLGTVDLQDQVDGVRHLARRPYVDGDRVGIYGHSYGGFMAALAILKHPEVFHVAVASSAFFNDTATTEIYTERYMDTPEANPEGYDRGSCLTYAAQLTGRLLLMHGMIDDNVHPTNAWQLIHALNEEGRAFDMMLLPDKAHALGKAARKRRVEYLYEHLVGRSE
jgi:dipeptidyl-peptidase-4